METARGSRFSCWEFFSKLPKVSPQENDMILEIYTQLKVYLFHFIEKGELQKP